MSERVGELVQALDGDRQWQAYGDVASEAVSGLLPEYLAAKGYTQAAVQGLARHGILGRSIDTLLAGNHTRHTISRDRFATEGRQNYINAMASQSYVDNEINPWQSGIYDGYSADNASILSGITQAAIDARHSGGFQTQREFRRNGASRNLWLPNMNLDHIPGNEILTKVPIAIVGAGASGVLASAYLNEMGFGNITLFDKRGKANGIWKQSNVREGSKNNPFDISFQDVTANSARPGFIEGSGAEIDRFLEDVQHLYQDEGKVVLRKASVKSIEPGDLQHRITFVEDGETKIETYPIVIYAPGIGSPLEPNDPARMTTPHSNGEVGQRWQRQFSQEDLQKLGKRVVIVGLGNSTAEIVHQLQQSAHDIDYRILSHRSLVALNEPDYHADGAPIYRNIDEPELTRLAGDLPHIRELYKRAHRERKILPNVKHWHHDGNIMTAVGDDGIESRIPYDTLFTLIGYGQKPETNEAMGLTTIDERTGSISYDFDGEVQRGNFDPSVQKARRRVHPGYFALGPILKTPENPNAIVIPGIQHQLQFMSQALLCRAAEVVYGHRPRTVERLMGSAANGPIVRNTSEDSSNDTSQDESHSLEPMPIHTIPYLESLAEQHIIYPDERDEVFSSLPIDLETIDREHIINHHTPKDHSVPEYRYDPSKLNIVEHSLTEEPVDLMRPGTIKRSGEERQIAFQGTKLILEYLRKKEERRE